MAAFFHPRFWHDLFFVPAAAAQVEQSKARQVTRGNLKVVGRMNGSRTSQVVHIARLKILHPNWFRDALIESLADFQSRLFFEDRSKDVEVPVVVIPEGSRRVAAACWPVLLHWLGFKLHLVIHTRTRTQQINYPRLLLFFRQGIGRIVNS